MGDIGFLTSPDIPEGSLIYLRVILFLSPVINSGLIVQKILVACEKLTVSEKVPPHYSMRHLGINFPAL